VDYESPSPSIFKPEPEIVLEESIEEPVENRLNIVTLDALEELQQ
ncbi:25298_t:CDS:1, partial [Gigaspora margarita]